MFIEIPYLINFIQRHDPKSPVVSCINSDRHIIYCIYGTIVEIYHPIAAPITVS